MIPEYLHLIRQAQYVFCHSIECMQKNCRQACFPYVYICNLAVVQDIVFVGMPASNGFNKI